MATTLACGCTVEIIDGELHAFPCSPDHEQTLASAAAMVAEANGIPFDIIEAS